jgi:hypothetical protein
VFQTEDFWITIQEDLLEYLHFKQGVRVDAHILVWDDGTIGFFKVSLDKVRVLLDQVGGELADVSDFDVIAQNLIEELPHNSSELRAELLLISQYPYCKPRQ